MSALALCGVQKQPQLHTLARTFQPVRVCKQGLISLCSSNKGVKQRYSQGLCSIYRLGCLSPQRLRIRPCKGFWFLQGSAEAVRDAVQALSSETIGVKVVAMGVGPVSASDVLQANAVGADIIAFNVKTAGADVDTAIKKAGVEMMSHRVIYSLLDEVSSMGSPLCRAPDT